MRYCLIIAALVFLGLACSQSPGSYLRPVDDAVLAQLPAADAKALTTYSTNHADIYDLRLHSMATCPILTYPPAYAFKRGEGWGVWLLDFYRAKHDEEHWLPWRACTCESELGP